LASGQAEYYIVRIEAVADPTSPRIHSKDQDIDEIRRQISALFERLKDHSEQQAIDQVFRTVTLTLCNACYSRWIENPTNA
jgi:hypothetical protein